MDVLTVVTVLSPFVAAGLTYVFTIKTKRREIDIEREKELNLALSNLLDVWFYLTRIEMVVDVLSGKRDQLIFSHKILPTVLVKSSILHDHCFQNLDSSVQSLRKYMPLVHYQLNGFAARSEYVTKQFLLPYLQNINLKPDYVVGQTRSPLSEILQELEDLICLVGKNIDKKTEKEINEMIDNYLDRTNESIIHDLNVKYYEMAIDRWPTNQLRPTFQQFKEISKTEEFRKTQELELKLINEGTMASFIDLYSKNPNASLEEIMEQISKEK